MEHYDEQAVMDQFKGEAFTHRFAITKRRLYEAIGDPFLIADRFPPDWSARGPLPPLGHLTVRGGGAW